LTDTTATQPNAPAELTPEEKAELLERMSPQAIPPEPKPDETPTPSPDEEEPTEEPKPEQEPVAEPVAALEPAEVKSTRKSFVQRLKDLLTPAPKDEAFSVVKGLDGKWHWHAIHTNNFKDLEDEILTESAHDAYIARVDMGIVPMPVLQGWHTEGTEHGEADLIWRNGHFVHSFGHFYETPTAEKAIAYYRKNAGKLKLSHGFTSSQKDFDGKHYHDYNTFEISVLPPYAAANPYTTFEEIVSMNKAMSDEKRRFLSALVGDDKVTEIEAKDDQRAKALEERRIEFKDLSNVTPAEDKPEAEATVKALGELYLESIEGQNETITMLGTVVKTLKDDREANTKEIAGLKALIESMNAKHLKEINELRTLLNQPPRRASADEDTLLTDKEREVLKDKTPQDDPLAKFIGVPLKAQEN
jgi:hypothetical protein